VQERAACAQLKQRFEAVGFRIKENQSFNEDGVRFDIDGYDAVHRVGYEYVTSEAGDGWDVDGDVIAALAERRKRGELHVLVVDEADAPDEPALDAAIDDFLDELRDRGVMPRAASQSEPPAKPRPPPTPKAKPPPTPKAGAKKKPSRKPG
jgi:hypothetical protein